jgi:hypothetical protein
LNVLSAAQPPAIREQEPATPERPAIETYAERVVEPLGSFAFGLGEDSASMRRLIATHSGGVSPTIALISGLAGAGGRRGGPARGVLNRPA